MLKKLETICDDLYNALIHKSQKIQSGVYCDMNSVPFFAYVCSKAKNVKVLSKEGNWISVSGEDWEIHFKMED